MKKVKDLPGDQGFTLIEVLVVIAILSILLTVAIPGFSRWLPNYRLKGAARDLYSNLQLAKMGAVKERGEWAVVFSAGSNRYQVVSGGADRSYSTTADNVVEKTVNLNDYGSEVAYGAGSATSGILGTSIADVISFQSPDDVVVFNSRGMINGNGGYAYLQNSRKTVYGVGTWPSGAVVLRKWSGSTWK
jgi:prepilin-type N-terminal cleavage/methylation domain-containing protein